MNPFYELRLKKKLLFTFVYVYIDIFYQGCKLFVIAISNPKNNVLMNFDVSYVAISNVLPLACKCHT